MRGGIRSQDPRVNIDFASRHRGAEEDVDAIHLCAEEANP